MREQLWAKPENNRVWVTSNEMEVDHEYKTLHGRLAVCFTPATDMDTVTRIAPKAGRSFQGWLQLCFVAIRNTRGRAALVFSVSQQWAMHCCIQRILSGLFARLELMIHA
jgi:hypothetical protein